MTTMTRLLIALVLTLGASPAFAQQWDSFNGSMQTKTSTTTPAVIIEQDGTGKILSLRGAAAVEKFSVDKDGNFTSTGTFTFANGTAAAPAIAFTSEPTTGLYLVSAGLLGIDILGTPVATFYNGTSYDLRLKSDAQLGWTSGAATAVLDTILVRGAANRLDLATGDSFNVVSGDVIVNGSSVTVGVATGYKVARGSTALDGSNPTTVATGLTTVVACTGTLLRNTAVSSGTALLTHAAASGANVDWYGWVIAGSASAGTEVFEWVCVGT